MKLTEWYPPEIKPVRKGLYECKECLSGGAEYTRHYWGGSRWLYFTGGIPFGGLVSVTWRGVKK